MSKKLFSPVESPLHVLARGLSLFGSRDRIVFAFPGQQDLIIEFPTDDALAPALSTCLKTTRDCGITFYSSPKRNTALRSTKVVRPGSTLDPRAHDSLTAAVRSAGQANCFAFPPTRYSSGLVRSSIEAHASWNATSPLTAGRGPICTLASSASLGCAFISRMSVWDGLRFNDPAAFLFVNQNPALGFAPSNEVLLVELAKYSLLKAEALAAQIDRAAALLGHASGISSGELRANVDAVSRNLEAVERYAGGPTWLRTLKTA